MHRLLGLWRQRRAQRRRRRRNLREQGNISIFDSTEGLDDDDDEPEEEEEEFTSLDRSTTIIPVSLLAELIVWAILENGDTENETEFEEDDSLCVWDADKGEPLPQVEGDPRLEEPRFVYQRPEFSDHSSTATPPLTNESARLPTIAHIYSTNP